jgi:hypothetical protein
MNQSLKLKRDEEANDHYLYCLQMDDIDIEEAYKAGYDAAIQAVIELLGEFEETKADSEADGNWHYSAFRGTNEECFMGGARWQHEQILAKLKGEV